MKSLKIIVKEFNTKEGKTFMKATCKGKYIPLALAEDEVTYVVKFAGDLVKFPTKEGVYEVAFEDNGAWIDLRPEYAEKHILRVKATKVVFNKALKVFANDLD